MIPDILMWVAGFGGALVGYVTANRAHSHQDNKISKEKVETLVLKVPPTALPEYSRGPGDGYRQIAARHQCEVCRRACVHCRREAKRRTKK